MTSQLDKTYQPEAIEQFWYQRWEANDAFSPSAEGQPFCIILPPPNVTGSLHMGHGFGFTLADVLIRYERMLGKKTLWQPGTDHAGIATQMVVERQLNQKGLSRHELGREAFIAKVWEWKAESGGQITRQLRRLGASLDWSRERFTMDETIARAVNEVFIRLYDEGLIYRRKRLVNWDPILLTAISDLEVINAEEQGKLWYIRYPLVRTENNPDTEESYVVVATTRPETMLGDVALAVNPNDEKYKHLLGKQVKLPLTDRVLTIIADEFVDPSFGTGIVKITPAHDFNDHMVGERHQLTPINIFTPHAHMNNSVPDKYRGLDRFKARNLIVEDLEKQNLIEKITPHQLKVPRGDRSNAIIEPYLTYQWYINIKPLAEPAIAAVKNGDIRFVPDNWSKTYFQWMENIEDWCISRQLWWGHRIPVFWDDENNKHYAGHDEADVRRRYQIADHVVLRQENDVLDTWFSAALWPFSVLGWPNNTADLKQFYPSNVMITAFDIIFFWVARMIMMGLKFMNDVPFREVYITGLIRDAEGHKMSKSKGNVLDPIDLIDGITLEDLVAKRTYGLMQPQMAKKIEKATHKEFPDGIASYGTDALRFTFCSFASYTREIRFDINRLSGYRNFCNKLWNAARYVLMNTENYSQPSSIEIKQMTFSLADRYIQAQLQKVIRDVHQHLKQYRFDLFAQSLYDFVWNEYCDWYLELSKPVLTSLQSGKAELSATRYTLLNVLETLLRLLHPITPFITEELWQRIAPFIYQNKPDTIIKAAYPEVTTTPIDEGALIEVDWLKQIIVAIRTIRSEMNISPAKRIDLLLRHGTAKDRIYLERHDVMIKTLAKIENTQWLQHDESPPAQSATAVIGELELFIPLQGLINPQDEVNRLQKEYQKLQNDFLKIHNKLNNQQFIAKAPQDVVSKEKERYEALKLILQKLEKQLRTFGKHDLDNKQKPSA